MKPLDATITVLVLADDAYVKHGVFRHGDQASSPILDGFTGQTSSAGSAARSVRKSASVTTAAPGAGKVTGGTNSRSE